MGAGGVSPGVLTASLVALLLEVCRTAGGADWRVPGTTDPFKPAGEGGSGSSTWTGPKGTHPPRSQLSVWSLVPESAAAQDHAKAIAAKEGSGSLAPAWLTLPLLREMLQRGLASPHERLPSYGIMSELSKGSTLLHKVGVCVMQRVSGPPTHGALAASFMVAFALCLMRLRFILSGSARVYVLKSTRKTLRKDSVYVCIYVYVCVCVITYRPVSSATWTWRFCFWRRGRTGAGRTTTVRDTQSRMPRLLVIVPCKLRASYDCPLQPAQRTLGYN